MVDTNKYIISSIIEIKQLLEQENPNSWQFTHLLREALTGTHQHLISALLDYKNSNENLLNLNVISIVETLSFEQILKHLPVLEKACHKNDILKVIINKDNNNLKLMEIQKKLVDVVLSKGATIANSLTLFHDAGHGFIKLECMDCANGEPVSIHVGLYPADDNDSCEFSGDKNGIMDFLRENEKFVLILPFIQSILSGFSYILGYTTSGHIKAVKSISESSFFTSGLSNLYYTGSENSDTYQITREFEGGHLNKPIYFNCPGEYRLETLKSIHSKSLNISKNHAELVFNQIMYLSSHCSKDYEYKGFGHNCLDFVQEMYNLAGFEGDHFNEMYAYKYPLTIIGAYKAIYDGGNTVLDLLHNAKLYFEDLF
jgi:hypothetical protein